MPRSVSPQSREHCQPLPELYLDLCPLPPGLSQCPRLCVPSPHPQVAHLGDQPVRRQSRDLRKFWAWEMSTIKQSRHLSSGRSEGQCQTAGTPRQASSKCKWVLNLGIQKSEFLGRDRWANIKGLKNQSLRLKVLGIWNLEELMQSLAVPGLKGEVKGHSLVL